MAPFAMGVTLGPLDALAIKDASLRLQREVSLITEVKDLSESARRLVGTLIQTEGLRNCGVCGVWTRQPARRRGYTNSLSVGCITTARATTTMTSPTSKSAQVDVHAQRAEQSDASDSTVVSSDSTATDRPILSLERGMSRISTRTAPEYKVYKRRFFGLAQLVLLNIVVSWNWITFAPVSKSSAQYFNTTQSVINWLSTVFLFAFCASAPVSFWALRSHGPKVSIMLAAGLLLVGNWIRYGGTRSQRFDVVMFGQILTGFAQPFVLSAPPNYSNDWFSESGRTTATAVASLANPFGAALGQLIDPFWTTKASGTPQLVLYISIISSIACVPSFFIPARPPTPPSPGAASIATTQTSTPFFASAQTLIRSPEFWLISIPFGIYVGFFNSFSSLLNQILEPYGFSETDAGIAGALLIVVGLIAAAISSPLVDKYRFHLIYTKCAVPVIAFAYLAFIWAPQSRALGYPYTICAILGAASFGLVPVALEFLVEIHHPLSPEFGTSVSWTLGQLLGGIFIIIQTALRAGSDSTPPNQMKKALVFQAVLALLAMPLPLCLGLFGRRKYVRQRRLEADRQASLNSPSTDEVDHGPLRYD